MLTFHRHVAGQIGCAGLQDLHAFAGGKGLTVLVPFEDFGLHAQGLPIVRIGATLQMAGMHERLRHVDELVGIQIEVRKNRVVLAGSRGFVEILQKRVGRTRDACDIPGIEESFGAQRLAITNEQLPSPSGALCLRGRRAWLSRRQSVSSQFSCRGP